MKRIALFAVLIASSASLAHAQVRTAAPAGGRVSGATAGGRVGINPNLNNFTMNPNFNSFNPNFPFVFPNSPLNQNAGNMFAPGNFNNGSGFNFNGGTAPQFNGGPGLPPWEQSLAQRPTRPG